VTGKNIKKGGMEDAPEKGKESSYSAHSNGINGFLIKCNISFCFF
jgi:hypothetical protein